MDVDATTKNATSHCVLLQHATCSLRNVRSVSACHTAFLGAGCGEITPKMGANLSVNLPPVRERERNILASLNYMRAEKQVAACYQYFNTVPI